MKRKAKELQMAKREARKEGRSMYSGGYGGGGFGSHDTRGGGMGPMIESLPPPESKYNAPRSVCGCRSVCGYGYLPPETNKYQVCGCGPKLRRREGGMCFEGSLFKQTCIWRPHSET